MPWQNYRRIVLAVDGGQASTRVVRAAESMIVAEGVQASIVHGCLVPAHSTCGGWSRDAVVSFVRELLSNASRDIALYTIEVENSAPLEAFKVSCVVGTRNY